MLFFGMTFQARTQPCPHINRQPSGQARCYRDVTLLLIQNNKTLISALGVLISPGSLQSARCHNRLGASSWYYQISFVNSKDLPSETQKAQTMNFIWIFSHTNERKYQLQCFKISPNPRLVTFLRLSLRILIISSCLSPIRQSSAHCSGLFKEGNREGRHKP